jgi:DNA-binding transcriptional MerR regulator
LPYKEKEIEKKYYSIGEVASKFKVATSLIRFWETEFDIIKPKKNKKGNRQYVKADIEKIHLIYTLVKEKGYTLQGAREHIKTHHGAVSNKAELIQSLKNVRHFLADLRDKLPS